MTGELVDIVVYAATPGVDGTEYGDITVTALTTNTPGIVITADPAHSDNWCVAHQRSGLGLFNVDDPEQAAMAADRLDPAVDWTRDADVVGYDPLAHAAVAEVRAGLPTPRYKPVPAPAGDSSWTRDRNPTTEEQ